MRRCPEICHSGRVAHDSPSDSQDGDSKARELNKRSLWQKTAPARSERLWVSHSGSKGSPKGYGMHATQGAQPAGVATMALRIPGRAQEAQLLIATAEVLAGSGFRAEKPLIGTGLSRGKFAALRTGCLLGEKPLEHQRGRHSRDNTAGTWKRRARRSIHLVDAPRRAAPSDQKKLPEEVKLKMHGVHRKRGR